MSADASVWLIMREASGRTQREVAAAVCTSPEPAQQDRTWTAGAVQARADVWNLINFYAGGKDSRSSIQGLSA